MGHDGSDLDIALRGPGLDPIADRQAFQGSRRPCANSTLPFLVEAHDWARLPQNFHEEIERNYAVLMSE